MPELDLIEIELFKSLLYGIKGKGKLARPGSGRSGVGHGWYALIFRAVSGILLWAAQMLLFIPQPGCLSSAQRMEALGEPKGSGLTRNKK